MILFCEKFSQEIGLNSSFQVDVEKIDLSKEEDPSDKLITAIQEKISQENIEEALKKVKVDLELIDSFVEYFEGNLNALFSRIEKYKGAFYYDEVIKQRVTFFLVHGILDLR